MTRPLTAIVAELEQRDLRSLVEKVATAHHVTLGELLAPARDVLAVQARQAVWRALWADPEVDWSISRIARLFGVDRATVSYALRGRPRDGKPRAA